MSIERYQNAVPSAGTSMAGQFRMAANTRATAGERPSQQERPRPMLPRAPTSPTPCPGLWPGRSTSRSSLWTVVNGQSDVPWAAWVRAIVATLTILRVATPMLETPNTPLPRRTYREAERTAFLDAFERLGKVSLAAREVGLHPAGCYKWLVDVGIDAKKHSRARRSEYFRLRQSGTARADAARQAGLNIRTAIDWDQGIEHASNRRVYPHGRVIDYN